MKDFTPPTYRIRFQSAVSKEYIQHFKTRNFFAVFYGCWSLLPAWICLSGFIISKSTDPIETRSDSDPDPKNWFGCYVSFALALILVHVLVRHAVGASRMEGSLGVSLYLSRIQQEIIAEGGTQTSPSLRYNH